MVNDLLNNLSMMVATFYLRWIYFKYYLPNDLKDVSILNNSSCTDVEIVEEIIDHDLKENIRNKKRKES